MPSVRRPSVRLWQTELFIIVIVVAILILSVSLSQGLTGTLQQLGERTQLSNASALASQLSAEFPLTVESRARLRPSGSWETVTHPHAPRSRRPVGPKPR